MRNHLTSYDVLILENSFHDVSVECDWNFILSTDRLAMSCMPSFVKVKHSRNSHVRRLSDMPGMGLLISPSLQTYTANIGIQRGSIPIYASMFWVTLAGDSISFRCGGDTRFHDAHFIYVS